MSNITYNEDGSATVALVAPFAGADGKIDSIRLRRPKVKELRAIGSRDGIEATVFMIAQLSGIAPALLDAMDGEDFATVSTVVTVFLGKKPAGDA